MSYTAKYASAFYGKSDVYFLYWHESQMLYWSKSQMLTVAWLAGPFRDALDSAPRASSNAVLTLLALLAQKKKYTY